MHMLTNTNNHYHKQQSLAQCTSFKCKIVVNNYPTEINGLLSLAKYTPVALETVHHWLE